MADLQPHHAEWLSLIRYQFDAAKAQAIQPDPLNSFAISSAHDAVEGMLSLAAEVLGADVKPRADFIAVFDAVNSRLPEGQHIAGYRSAMNALNNARVGFKHHGNRSDALTLTRHLSNASDFLRDACINALGIEFTRVSLLLFIPNDQVRTALQTSEADWRAGRPQPAFQGLRIAFDDFLQDYEARKSWSPNRSLFSTKPNFLPSGFDIRGEGEVAERTFEWLESLDFWVRILALGIDAREYAFFDAHTPRAVRALSGQVHFFDRPGSDLTEDVYERCRRFVVTSALDLTRDDFTFDAWSARSGRTTVSE